MKNNKQKVSNTLSGGPRQGRSNQANRASRSERGRDSAGLTNRGSSTGQQATGSRAAGLNRDSRADGDDRMNADRNPTIATGERESRNIMNSAASGQDTTTGPGEARRSIERRGDIFDPERPDSETDLK